MNIAHDAAADEDILDAAEVRVAQLVEHADVVELDVEVLVDGLEGAADGDVVFELDGDGYWGLVRSGGLGGGGGGGRAYCGW